MSDYAYEEIDHMADLAIKVWGEGLQALFSHAALGMYHLMGVKGVEGSEIEESFVIPEGTKESMLVDFLNECLYLTEAKRVIFNAFSLKMKESGLSVRATGSKLYRLERNIKGVTFHDLEIDESDSGMETIITFDV